MQIQTNAASYVPATTAISTASLSKVTVSGGLINLFTNLTPGDRALIQAATGANINAQGVVTNPNGAPVSPLIVSIAADRSSGRLSGSITPQYLKGLFGQAEEMGQPYPPQYLSNGLQYLASQSSAQTTAQSGNSLDLTV